MIKETDLRIGNVIYYQSSENELLPNRIDWQDGLIYVYEFKEESNKEIEIKDGDMVWADESGPVEITILVKREL